MTRDGDRCGVLIVEDDEDLAALYEEWLTPTYRVDAVGTGEAALERMGAVPADVVLLDRHLPSISGDDVLRTLRNRGYDQPVAMVTAVDPEFNILELGFDEYLTKPVGRDDLHGTVERLLERGSWVELQRDLSAKKIKRNVLEVEHDESELATREEYVRLVGEIERLEARLSRRKARVEPTSAD